MAEFYNLSVEDCFKELKSNKSGLTSTKAKRLEDKFGLNQLEDEKKINKFKLFIDQFKSFIIYILIFATVLSLLSGEMVDAGLILIILLANAFIGYFQELSAAKSLDALKKLTSPCCKVYRDGKIVVLDSRYLFPGDVLSLEAGDTIPADARIIRSHALRVNESALTGESLPVEKSSNIISNTVSLGDQLNMVFASSAVQEGSATALVLRTGMKSEIGKITSMIHNSKDELTPLQKKLDVFGKKLSYAIVAICIIVFGLLLLAKGTDDILMALLVAVSLAVAAVPTALPAVVTVALSLGVKKLAKKKALARKLSSVETLGSCDVICTDKTGTLTKNEMTVIKAWSLSGESAISGLGYSPVGFVTGLANSKLFEIGTLCNNASVFLKQGTWTIAGDPTEAALIVSAKKSNFKIPNTARVDELPFNSDRKLMSTLYPNGKSYIQYTKGAPNILLEACSHVLIGNSLVKITSGYKKEILKQVDAYSKDALRVLAFAYKEISSKDDFVEEHLVFTGLQAMIDPPREDVIDSIRKAKIAGIRIIMITGDYIETAKAIAKNIGITGDALTGSQISEMTDKQLLSYLKKGTNIFARVIPEHKQRIVTLLQEMDYIVAMTGDGVNDAPALKKANIGVAVGSGTEVAKEASDFVLLDDSFTHVINAIEEGRGIYSNIQKSIMLLLSGNFAEVLVIFLAVLFQFNLPLTAVMLLWINLITDGAPALAFTLDPYDKNGMKKRPIPAKQFIMPPRKLAIIIYRGIVGAAITLGLFWYFTAGFPEGSPEHILAQTVAFTFIILSELVHTFIIRTEFGVPFFTNKSLWGALGLSIGLQALVIYTPARGIFGVAPLSFFNVCILFGSVVVFVLSYLFYNKFIQSIFFKDEGLN